jgi:hypothetical protein
MCKRILALLVLLAVAAPAAPAARRTRGRLSAPAAELAQIWRLTSLTMRQRLELRQLQESRAKVVRAGVALGAGRGALAEAERIVGRDAVERARTLPAGPLALEELLYYPITSLTDVPAVTRAKIDAVFGPALAQARSERPALRRVAKAGGEDSAGAADARGARRQQSRALFEVLEALLTRDQLLAVRECLPGRLRAITVRPQRVMRMPSLTMEQEARVVAIFAALDDETAADRARREAIGTELESASGASRRALAAERRTVDERIGERRKRALEDLAKVLSQEQMKELRAMTPGPQRPLVFAPERLRSLTLAADQRRRVAGAMRAFRLDTASERSTLAALRARAKESDIRAMESAPLRDEIRKAARPVDEERNELAREVAQVLTGEQLAELVRDASRGPAAGPRSRGPADEERDRRETTKGTDRRE